MGPEGHSVPEDLANIKPNMKATNRLRRHTARSAPWGSPLPLVKTKSGEPGSPVVRVGMVSQQRAAFTATTSSCRDSEEPKKPDNPRSCQLRVGSLNVGAMSGRDGELADMAGRRGLDFCCFQETRCRGESNKWLGEEGKRYKFFWKGCGAGLAGVGVLVAEKWVENVIEVKKLSERIMLISVSIGVNIRNVISGYAPQVGRAIVEKKKFWLALSKIVDEIRQDEFVVIGGHMNGHVGRKADGYEGVDG